MAHSDRSTDRPDLLLLPGTMCDAALWADMEPGLKALGRLHYGDLSTGSTIVEMASNVLAAAPDRFVLIGFSMGGYVARRIALEAPERVQALVLISSSARGDSPEMTATKRATLDAIRTVPFRGLSRAVLAASVHPDRADDQDLLGRIQAMARRLGEETFLRQMALRRTDGHEDLPRITCPALVVWSRQDRMRTPEEARELAQGLPKVRLDVIEDSGHMTPLERPQDLLACIRDWLGALAAQGEV